MPSRAIWVENMIVPIELGASPRHGDPGRFEVPIREEPVPNAEFDQERPDLRW